MTIINLIPPETLEQRDAQRCLRAWVLRLGAGFLVLALAYVALGHMGAHPAEELELMTKRHAHLQDRLLQAQSLIGERDRLSRARTAIGSIRESQPAGWFLEVMGDVLTREAYLVWFGLDRRRTDESAPSRADGEEREPSLRLRGRAPGHRQVGEILRRMASSGAFAEVDLISAKEPRGLTSSDQIEFELLCTLTEEGSARW